MIGYKNIPSAYCTEGIFLYWFLVLYFFAASFCFSFFAAFSGAFLLFLFFLSITVARIAIRATPPPDAPAIRGMFRGFFEAVTTKLLLCTVNTM